MDDLVGGFFEPYTYFDESSRKYVGLLLLLKRKYVFLTQLKEFVLLTLEFMNIGLIF